LKNLRPGVMSTRAASILNLTDAICKECRGTGVDHELEPEPCEACGGSGYVINEPCDE
jgi:DnaJ-class molecular chaperone